MNKKAKSLIISGIIISLVLIFSITSYFIFVSASPGDPVIDGMVTVSNMGVTISAKEVEHCVWRPDGVEVEDGKYKICEAIIEGYNPQNYSLKVTKPGLGFSEYFMLDKEARGKQYTYFFSNQFELYNESILNKSKSCNSSLSNCFYEVERKRFYNWTLLNKNCGDTPIHNSTDFAYKVKFEIYKSLNASYNFSVNFQKLDGGVDIPILLDPDISACGTLDTEGATYTLTSNIGNVVGNCFVINANSITLDMQDHTIKGHAVQSAPYGVYSTLDSGLTIKNGTVTNFDFGVFFEASQSNEIINMNTSNNKHSGMALYSTSNSNTLINNTASSNTYNGIVIESNSDSNNLTNNTANNNGYDGVYILTNSDNNVVHKSTFYNNGKRGVFIKTTSTNNNVTNNNLSKNVEYGIRVESSSDNNLKNNIIQNNTLIGLLIYLNSNSSSVINNTVNSNEQSGIVIHTTSSGNIVTNNTANSNTQYGIVTESCSNNTFTNNTANSNGHSGIYIYLSSNSTIVNNTANSNTYMGIYVLSGSNNTFTSNIANSNSMSGIRFGSGSNNNVVEGITLHNNTDDSIGIEEANNSQFTNIDLVTFGDATNDGAIWLSAASNNSFRDGNFTTNMSWIINVTSTSTNNTFLNCSYNTTKEYVSSGSELIRKWYFDAQVNYTHNSSAVSNANITAFNDTTFQFSVLSGADGSITHQSLMGYINNGTTSVYYSNYTINATKTGWNPDNPDSYLINMTTNVLQQFNIANYIAPLISIVYPQNTTYATNVSELNYTFTDTSPDSCWWSNNSGIWNSSIQACGTNWTGLTSEEGSNNWTVYINDSAGNENLSSVVFFKDSVFPKISIVSPTNSTNTTDTGLDIKYTFTETNPDTCWWNDGDGANTTLASCGTNITIPTWQEGKHNITLFINDTANNVNKSYVSFTIDTTAPVITIDHPQPQTYPTNASLSLNYTIVDGGVGVDSCWYKIINSTSDLIIDNTTLASCANITFNISQGEGTYNLTLYSNDTLNNLNSSEVEFAISLTAPAIVLDAPIDNQHLSNGTQVSFNFTATDTDGLDTCQLWHNNTGIWHKNYTWVGPTTGVMNYTTLNLSENTFIWNVWCNDSGDINDWALNNFTLTIDLTNPQITLVYPTNTSYNSVQTELNFSYSDTNVGSCWYSTDAGATNVTHVSCANLTGLSSGQGSSTWLIGINDSAGNENYSTIMFFVDSINPQISYEPEAPVDYANLSQSNIYVNVTWTEANLANITFSLYNATGTINQTTFTIATYEINWTGLPEGNNYTYQVNITDTLNNKNYTLLRNVTLDTTDPNVTITTANGTTVSGTYSITVEYNISDTYLKQCYFTLRTSGGIVHNYPENTSLSCSSTSRSVSTLLYGTFVLQIWGEDYASNLNYSNLTFITRATPVMGGGGGSSTVLEEEPDEPKTFCGDGICQSEGNDYGIKENFWNCGQDCPGFNFDELIWSFSKYCFDGDNSTICFFQTLFSTVPGKEIGANMTVYRDGQVCIGEICEKLSGKSIFTNCLDGDINTPCFFSSNFGFFILFSTGAGFFALSMIKIRTPGAKGRVNPYKYIYIKTKKFGRRRRR